MKIKVTSKTLAAGDVEGEGKIMHPIPRLSRQRAASLFGDESGAATAEYAITTMERPPVLTEPRWANQPLSDQPTTRRCPNLNPTCADRRPH